MRESRRYGSVRGARGDARPYRDQAPLAITDSGLVFVRSTYLFLGAAFVRGSAVATIPSAAIEPRSDFAPVRRDGARGVARGHGLTLASDRPEGRTSPAEFARRNARSHTRDANC
jgi:hypothetical protein